jgi:hypothetical protein
MSFEHLDNQLTNKEDIQNWLDKMNIKNYTIYDNLVVDVDYPVLLSYKNIETIPFQFGVVQRDFLINGNKLKTLKGMPFQIKGKMDCSRNQLISLEYTPQKISTSMICGHNQIKSLKGLPSKINWDLFINDNQLSNLDYLPSEIGNVLNINNNPLTSLKGIKKIGNYLQIKNINLSNCSIDDLLDIEMTEEQVFFEHIISNYNEALTFLKDEYKPYQGLESHLVIEAKEFKSLIEKLKLESLENTSCLTSQVKKIKI